MAPPSFEDLGKSARDLFSKGYNCGLIKVETTTTSNGSEPIEFKTSAIHTTANGNFKGNFDVKYKVPSLGVTLTEKWNTDNVLGTVLEVTDQFSKDLKVTFDTTYGFNSGTRAAKVKAKWCKNNVTADLCMDVYKAPVVNASFVGKHNGWMFGLAAGIDTATNMLIRSDFGFAKYGPDYSLFSYASNGKDFGLLYSHQLSRNLEIGAKMEWTVGAPSTKFMLGAKYSPTRDLELRAKVDHESNVALCGTHYISDELKVILSTQFGLHELSKGTHKLGFGIEYKP